MPLINIRQFGPLMRQRVTLAPKTGYDDFGAPSFGAGVVYQAAVVGDMKLVRNAAGQEAPSRQQVYLMGNPAIRPEDQITLSTGDVGSTESYAINPLILSVSRYPFLNGQFATVVYLF